MKKTFTLGAFFFSLVFSGTSVFASTILSEDFDSYSNGYYLKDMLNWSISTYEISPYTSNNFYVSSPLSLRFPPSSANNWQYYYFDDIINEDFTFSFDFLTTYVNKDGLRILFSDSYPQRVSRLKVTVPAYPAEICIANFTNCDLSVFSNMQSYTWYHIDIEFSFSTHSIRVNVDNTGWSDWVGFANITDHVSSFAFHYENKAYSNITNFYIDNLEIPVEINGTYLWSDWCGSDAGKLIETTPINLCDVGTAGTVGFDGSKWSWDCIDGVVSQSCRAYLATTEPVDGTCGDWNGETFNTWPPLTELCELRTSLVFPSMVETINGYTWTCSGINGGTSDYCSGNKTLPPLMPELPAGSLDDCSGLSILEGLICNMGNTLKTIFLPSSEKINELNQTINKMAGKFPFSYISKATETFNDVKGNITETSLLELSIMGSEKSTIDFSTIKFFDYIKMLTTILIIIVFSFWLIRFIKDIF